MATKQDGKSSLSGSDTLVQIDQDFLNTSDLIAIASKRNADGAETDVYDEFEDQYSCYRHHRTKNASTQAYNAWMERMSTSLQKDQKHNGFLSVTTLSARNEYLHTWRFKDYASLTKWLRSDSHTDWAGEGARLCEEVGHDVSQGGASFLPSSMGPVAQKIMKMMAKPKQWTSQEQTDGRLEGWAVKSNPSRCCEAPFSCCGPNPTCCGKPFAIEGPPPEWRQSIVIWCSAVCLFYPYIMLVLPTVYGTFLPHGAMPHFDGGQPDLAPPTPCIVVNNSFIPGECGSERVVNNVMFWGFLITDCIMNVFMLWFGVPFFSILCRPFTHGFPRFAQCGLNCEPFTTLDDGFPCCRPRKKPWEIVLEDTNARLQQMEIQLMQEARLRSSLRNRFRTRLTRLEGKKPNIRALTTQRSDAVMAAEVHRRVNAEMTGLNNAKNPKPSVYIETWVVQDNFAQANSLLHDIARAMHDESSGFKGMVVVTPKSSGVALVTPQYADRVTGMSPAAPYHLFFEYDTVDQLKKWMGSETRLQYLIMSGNVFRGPPEGGAPVVRVEVHDALSSLFSKGATHAKSLSKLHQRGEKKHDEVLQFHPATWKMWCVLNIAFGVVGLPMVDLWLNKPPAKGILPSAGPVFLLPPIGQATPGKVALLMLVVVPIVVYVSVPVVLYFAGGWVFEPWKLSTNPLFAWLQEGFPCCLATGPRNEANAEEEDEGVEMMNPVH